MRRSTCAGPRRDSNSHAQRCSVMTLASGLVAFRRCPCTHTTISPIPEAPAFTLAVLSRQVLRVAGGSCVRILQALDHRRAISPSTSPNTYHTSRRRQLQLQPVPPPRCRGCGHPRALFTPPPPALPSKGSDRSVTAPTAVGAHQPPPTTSPRPGRRGRLWRLPPPALPSNGADRLGLRRRAPARARCRRSQSQSLAATAAVTSRRSYRRRRYCHTPCGAAQPEQACNCWSALAAR